MSSPVKIRERLLAFVIPDLLAVTIRDVEAFELASGDARLDPDGSLS